MAKLMYAFPCARVIIDQATNLISFIDVLDGVVVPVFPFVAPAMCIGAIWETEGDKRIEMRARILAPDGGQVVEAAATSLDLKPEHKRARTVVVASGFVFPAPGKYQITVELKRSGKWVEASRIPIDIDPALPPQNREMVN
jgi:hypothetical protein